MQSFDELATMLYTPDVAYIMAKEKAKALR
jgi:hypothetical protein